MCVDGYSSSFAALSLREIGFARATDLVGGFTAWNAEGLPVRWASGAESAEHLPGMGAPEPFDPEEGIPLSGLTATRDSVTSQPRLRPGTRIRQSP